MQRHHTLPALPIKNNGSHPFPLWMHSRRGWGRPFGNSDLWPDAALLTAGLFGWNGWWVWVEQRKTPALVKEAGVVWIERINRSRLGCV